MQAFTVKTADFVAAIKRCSGVIERRNAIPVLATVKASFGPEGFELATTDLDIMAHAFGPASGAGAAEFLADFAAISAAVDALKESGALVIGLDEEKERVSVSAEGSRRAYLIPAWCGEYEETQETPNGKGGYEMTPTGKTLRRIDDFPALKIGEGADCLTIEGTGENFGAVLSSVAPAMSCEETRYYLNGIYLFPGDSVYSAGAVATDGHRLHLCEFSAMRVGGGAGVILPRKTVGLLQKILKAEKGAVSARFKETRGEISGEGWRIVSKLVDGSFPDFRRVIPAERANAVSVRVYCPDLIDFAKAAKKMSADRTRSMGITANGRLDCFVRSHEAGELRETIDAEIRKPADWSADDSVTIGVNSGYIPDLLGGLETATLQIIDPSSPILLKSPELAGLRVIMPLRV